MCSLCPHCAGVRAVLASVAATVRGFLPKDDKHSENERLATLRMIVFRLSRWVLFK